ncbi:SusC/RagA family TonB-linked outer membrane protein [Bacteroides oleiciplenus]|uniref:SusC/RagA family TonB-linked outer membrane protein n=1 Tax=Bacteroides oleiciplenus YIT 12058 TaxID=742727 RepID=K9EGE4_9BACE|nr:SusC/RagA family TonB-linked outer membrane protein [Bacteroides oleiciplenus]EKU89997.1 SusC/RagA family TonB-linked outer membrane protein [Bacteroides oleiciplenus YIT 12058]
MDLKLKNKQPHYIYYLFLVIAFFFASTEVAHSQVKNLSLHLKNVTLEEALGQIRQKGEYSLWYRNEEVNLKKKVSLDIQNGNITQILDCLFEGENLRYIIEDNHIVIFKADGTSKSAQQTTKRITGVIKDNHGEPIIGCNIMEKGTSNGTITSVDGDFSLNVAEKAVLQVSYIGYLTQEIPVQDKQNITVILQEDAQILDEVVVVGYGLAKKSDLTGSISQVKAESMQNYTPSSVSDLLRNSIPGMSVGYSVSAKGSSDMMIRGDNTLTAGSSPLIIVDGVIYNGDISDINPNDIEKLDIMKDASSAAVYGSRATNGVVAITTKKGNSQKPVINFSGSVGISTAANRVKPYDKEGFIKWRSDMFKSVYSATVPQTPWSPFDDPRTIDPQYLDQWMAYHSTTQDNLVDAWLSGLRLTGLEIENYKSGRSIDWEDYIFHNGPRQDYNLSLSGKKEDFSYYWSLGYMTNESLVKGDEFSTIRSRVNIEGKPARFLKVGLNAQFSYRDESSVPADVNQYTKLTPYSSFYEDDEETLRLYPNDDNQALHPLLNPTYRSREQEYFTLFPKIYATLDLPFGITYTVNYTTRFVFYHNHTHDSSAHPQWKLFGGSASRENSLRREWQVDNIINWNKTFAQKHKVDVTFLVNAEQFRNDTEKMNNQNFSPNDILGYHDMSIGNLPEISSNDEIRTSDALMARLNYGFMNKYLLTLSVRRDGSSLFGYSNPRATFPAAALGWVLSEEKFFKVKFVDYLKLRASWGINGNRDIDNYAALSKMLAEKSLNTDVSGTPIIIPTLEINTMGNKKLKWEKTEAYNLALDFRLFNGILNGTIETYYMSTTDVLVNRELPTITGYKRVYANLGEIRNKGLELSLSSTNMKQHNFEWTSNLLFALNRNKIISITGEKYDVFDKDGNFVGRKEPDDKTNNWFIGQAKDVIWDYKILGTWKTGQEEEAAKWNQAPGDFRLEDVNNDGLLTDEDKQFLGYKTPRFSWTLSNTFRLFNDFEFSFVLYSLWGHKGSYNLAKHDDHIEDRCNSRDIPYWTPENQLDDYARLRSAPAKGVSYSVWFDKSYIRLENVALAYKVPSKFLKKTPISNLKFSLNVKNAGIWAKDWKFGDPEDGMRSQRIFTFGLNMTL